MFRNALGSTSGREIGYQYLGSFRLGFRFIGLRSFGSRLDSAALLSDADVSSTTLLSTSGSLFQPVHYFRTGRKRYDHHESK
ncbi:MAG: hypothetical protein ACLSB9_27955 [Hydrogeniiclostridium mannosilyticum]